MTAYWALTLERSKANNMPMSQYIQLSTNKFKIWWDTTRWVALPQSAMPASLGGLLAFAHGRFNPLYFIIALLGVLVVHLGTNLLDDYGDLRMGGALARDSAAKEGSGPTRTVKAPYVLSGDIKLNQLLYVALGLFAAGIAACIFLTVNSGWPVAAIAAGGAIICFFYSMPPLKLSYRGLGELVVSVSMGPGICLGTYYAVTGTFDWSPVLVSLPVGILIGQILFIHSVMDYRPDSAASKRTLVALIGSQRRSISLLPYLIAVAYGSIVAGVALHVLPMATLLVLATVPMAVAFLETGNKLKNGDYDSIKAKWWMGPMEQMIEGHQWFLITWRQARNLLVFFTLLIFIGYAVDLIW
jgi:1,4-dihydroxy-2-naphthoate polyprenyltransferase